MGNGVSKIIKSIIDLGADDSLSFVEMRRLKVINYLALISSILWTLSGGVLISYGFYASVIINYVGVLFCAFSLWLNKRRFYIYAYYSLYIGTFLSASLISLHYGKESGVHYVFICWLVTSVFLFDKPKDSIPMFAIGSIAFIFLEFYQNHYDPLYMFYGVHMPERSTPFMKYVVMLVCFSMLKSVIEFFKINTKHYQEALAEKNEILTQQKEEILTQKELLEEQNAEIEQQNDTLHNAFDEITSSVSYASRIQKAILPPKKIINSHIPDLFILNKPKDIVSGDFFWFYESNEKVYIAAADCTGHGVPGAFMTAVGNTLLNQIVVDDSEVKPSQLLYKLHLSLQTTLNYEISDEKVHDGMDIAICVLDRANKSIVYAGAKRPLYICNNNSITEYKANRSSIGGIQTVDPVFTDNYIDAKEGDRFYIFSDGYPDQFGGKDGKKLKLGGFKRLICDIQKYPINSQKVAMIDFLHDWKSNLEQTDDILVIGFELR